MTRYYILKALYITNIVLNFKTNILDPCKFGFEIAVKGGKSLLLPVCGYNPLPPNLYERCHRKSSCDSRICKCFSVGSYCSEFCGCLCNAYNIFTSPVGSSENENM